MSEHPISELLCMKSGFRLAREATMAKGIVEATFFLFNIKYLGKLEGIATVEVNNRATVSVL